MLLILLLQSSQTYLYAKNLNVILNCKFDTGETFIAKIKNNKATIDDLDVKLKVDESYIFLNGNYMINRYTLEFSFQYGSGEIYRGSCKKLFKKII